MRIAIVSSYPPRHCGIGTYAHAQAARLRAEGHTVTVISPPDGDGDVRVPFSDGREFREAARRGASFDRIVVHFQPGLYYRPGATAAVSKIRTSLGLRALVRRRPQTEILVHEAHRPTRWRPDHVILRRAFAHARLEFHTNAEHQAFERDYRMRVPARIVDHREGVHVEGPRDRDAARRHLGLDPSRTTPRVRRFPPSMEGLRSSGARVRGIRGSRATRDRGIGEGRRAGERRLRGGAPCGSSTRPTA